MEAVEPKPRRELAWAGIGLFALVLGLALQQAVAQPSQRVQGWLGVGAAAAGIALLALAQGADRRAPWLIGLAIMPAAYLWLCMGEKAITREFLPVVRLGAGAALAVVCGVLVRRLPLRVQYVSCVAGLGGVALFFQLWEPPPPRPVPIRQSLAAHFDKDFTEKVAEQKAGFWKGTGQKGRFEHEPLKDKKVETALGADDYVNLPIQSADGRYTGVVFVTYNANAMSQIPHYPKVCMQQSGFEAIGERQDDIGIAALPGKEARVNVFLFQKGAEGEKVRSLILHYFNVGHTYVTDRTMARLLATTGSLGQPGCYISQTQVALEVGPNESSDPLAKDSEPYQLGVGLLNVVIPLLEEKYYPDLGGTSGGQ